MQIIAWDGGRNAGKSVACDRQLTIPSRVGEARDLRLGDPLDYRIRIGVEEYFVGAAAEESYCQREMSTANKAHEETKILCLTALAVLANGPEINLITGLPFNQHDPEHKQALTQLLQGQHTVIVNGAERVFTVQDIGIVPEGVGSYQNFILGPDGKPADPFLLSKTVRILMVGSRTISGLTIDHGRYRNRDSWTLDYGMIEADNAGGSLDRQFARRVAADASKKWLGYRPDNDVVILTGGGVLRMPELRDHFTVTMIPEDPVMADAMGMLKMGLARWGCCV